MTTNPPSSWVRASYNFPAIKAGALGYLMNFAQGSQNASLMMATVVIIMAVIVVLFAGLERVERRLMAWK